VKVRVCVEEGVGVALEEGVIPGEAVAAPRGAGEGKEETEGEADVVRAGERVNAGQGEGVEEVLALGNCAEAVLEGELVPPPPGLPSPVTSS